MTVNYFLFVNLKISLNKSEILIAIRISLFLPFFLFCDDIFNNISDNNISENYTSDNIFNNISDNNRNYLAERFACEQKRDNSARR